jgi:hypothetical protein
VGVTRAGPRIDSRLVASIPRLDRTSRPIAETCRRVGLVADALGLTRPSYEQVRVLVHDHRRRALRTGAGDILLDVAFRARPPEALLDLFD